MSLALTGRQDSAVGYSDLWKILEIYSRALFIILDKAGHNFKIEQPILFDGLVRISHKQFKIPAILF